MPQQQIPQLAVQASPREEEVLVTRAPPQSHPQTPLPPNTELRDAHVHLEQPRQHTHAVKRPRPSLAERRTRKGVANDRSETNENERQRAKTGGLGEEATAKLRAGILGERPLPQPAAQPEAAPEELAPVHRPSDATKREARGVSGAGAMHEHGEVSSNIFFNLILLYSYDQK